MAGEEARRVSGGRFTGFAWAPLPSSPHASRRDRPTEMSRPLQNGFNPLLVGEGKKLEGRAAWARFTALPTADHHRAHV